MVRLSRWLLVLMALIPGAAPVFAAPSPEDRAYAVAMDEFHTAPEMSEKKFADFVQKYPNSVRVSEAILYQAQARLFSNDADGAITLLTTNQVHADKLAPQYSYWLARARFQNKDYAGAADTFDDMLRKYPDSPQSLDATIREAGAYVRLEKWPRVVQLLGQTNGLFQKSVRAGAVSETVASGFLLLGEAQLRQGDFARVEETVKSLDKQTLNTQSRWQRDFLALRRQRAEGHLEDALSGASGLVLTEDKTNRAAGFTFQAGVLEQLGNIDAAVNAYTNNLTPEVPPDQQRLAILKITELDLRQNKLPDAAQRLQNFLEQFPAPEPTDLAVLTLGEVRLKQALSVSNTNLSAGATNLFRDALSEFDKILTAFTNSPLVGKAYLDKGWCLWSQGKIGDSQEAFSNAVERLPFSEEQAEARFKWADTQFQQQRFADAVTNYNFIAAKYEPLEEAKAHHLIERALYQSGRGALEETNLVAAMSALKNILEWYPDGFAGPSSLLLTGQGLAGQNDPTGARKLFSEFEERYPTNSLLPEVRLAIARSYEKEGNWDAAITNYSAWTEAFPRHYLMPQAKFSVAWDQYMAGRETNALTLFTNFIVHFPTNELAARAQWWVGDFYFRQGDYVAAENNYQLVFQNTNWPPSELTYRARLMAGSSAMARFAYKQAISYFTTLLTPDVPREFQDLQVQATMAYADATISQDSTNKTQDLNEAIQSLKTIPQTQPDTWQAAQAWVKIGDCYFDLGARDPDQYTNAAAAYCRVFESPHALSSAKNEARFKLGATIEKQAALKTGADQTALLKQALNQYVDSFYEGLHDSEAPSPFWTKKSGLQAAQLAESLQEWQSAYDIYKQLKDLLPVLAPVCEKKIAKISPFVPHP
ncbi:MAG TPA: tetratricopeptide repeat protein [Verrucomicrobiae bacterium]|jgi:TolA-binding protein|nr:tetratricopeptide repeat protein [Verrucomicrobiae bacterium]